MRRTRAKKLTREQALSRLTETRVLSTNLLEPLGVPFEWFLRYAQLSDNDSERVLDGLIAHLTKEGVR